MPMKSKQILAFDFGASGGRAMLGIFDGKTIRLEELHRFSNEPVSMNGTLYWDVLRLFHEVKQGLLAAKHAGSFDSVGVDTWGVDFALLDADGKLIENPIHYRDTRTKGMIKDAFQKMDAKQLYEITGNQIMEINTLFQLLSLQKSRPHLLEQADCLMLLPDYINYLLCGEKVSEYSIASTTQLLDIHKMKWSEEIQEIFQLPKHLFLPLVPYGSILGKLDLALCDELGIESKPVIAVAGHDTQSALISVPAKEEDFIFISCGTWSLLGVEIPEPITNMQCMNEELTNESAYGGKISLMKNIIGLWLIQESRRQWKREGMQYSYSELDEMASQAAPFTCLIDPNAPEFVPEGNIPERIRDFCRRTNQHVPQTPGEIVRCIYESLAFTYYLTIRQISTCTDKLYKTIHMIGGGTQSKMLVQMTANACGCCVTAGPTEATVLGNIAVQLMVNKDIKDLACARKIIADSFLTQEYEPCEQKEWEKAWKKYQEVVKC